MKTAEEILAGLEEINAHLGYQFTQPLVVAKAAMRIALKDAEARGLERAADIMWLYDDRQVVDAEIRKLAGKLREGK